MNPGPPSPAPGHEPEPVDLSQESVAGEEDPGASLDLPAPAAPPVPGQAGRAANP